MMMIYFNTINASYDVSQVYGAWKITADRT